MTTHTAKALPLTGTWISFFHQDARNNYTNPDAAEETNWGSMVDDLADLGMEKFIVMAMANQGTAAYPSRLRSVIRNEAGTPLDAVMESAASRGAGVYLSTGWANDQMDDLGSDDVVAGQLEILAEAAELYGSHPAFEGWYLPCEDSVTPRLSARTIEGVNRLSSAARALTPQARILISPYFPHGAVIDQEFVAALREVDVDIIAYQDGVGCAYTTTIAEQYPRLRWAHDQVPSVELWANVETFTWERGIANTWEDALVPAAFPRVHRQLLDAGSSVDRVVCFIGQGLLQDPPSRGVDAPDRSLRADYLDAGAGRGRWPILERRDELAEKSVSRGCQVAVEPRPVPGMFGEYRFTDGRLAATEDPLDPGWVRFPGDAQLSVDLGSVQRVGAVVVSFLHSPLLQVGQPSTINAQASVDGDTWVEHAWSAPRWDYQALDRWRDVAVIPVDCPTRYLQLALTASEATLLIDEIFVVTESDTGSKR